MRPQRSKRLQAIGGGLAMVLSGLLAISCGNSTFSGGGDDDAGNDAATVGDAGAPTDAAPDAPVVTTNQPFVIAVSPTSVNVVAGGLDVGVTITVTRLASFTDDISFTVDVPAPPGTDPGIGVSVAPNTGAGGDSSSFSLSVDSYDGGSFVPFVLSLQVVGMSTTQKNLTASAPLDVHVGS